MKMIGVKTKLKIRIFTDGACSENPGPGGWASIFNSCEKCTTYSGYEKYTTNNRMELKAVVESLKQALNLKDTIDVEDVEFELYSDSAYVVNAINNKWIEKWKLNDWKTTKLDDVKNKDLWEEFCFNRNKARSLGIYIKFIKIKGHSGNSFNEMVDKLAKEGVIKAKEEVAKSGGFDNEENW